MYDASGCLSSHVLTHRLIKVKMSRSGRGSGAALVLHSKARSRFFFSFFFFFPLLRFRVVLSVSGCLAGRQKV